MSKPMRRINLLAYKILVKKLKIRNMYCLDQLVEDKGNGEVYKDYRINRAYYKEKLEKNFQKIIRKEAKENERKSNKKESRVD